MTQPIATFSFPTLILFGSGTIELLPQRLDALGVTRPLVVTDPGLLKTEAFTLLQRALGPMETGKWFLFSSVRPNPIEQDVVDGAEAYRQGNCNGVVAIGGGSALDAGKAIRLLLKQPGMTFENFDWKADWSGMAPCICIPTTAGTGSEVGRSSVVTLKATGRKAVLFTPKLLADCVILDPVLTRGLPAKLTAATGVDALTHCIESFTCPSFHPMCDGIALEGIRLCVEALPKVFRDGSDLDARGKMLMAAAMGAVAFQKDLGATHSLAHPLSTVCGLHHGLANALCLPFVMQLNAERKPGLYRRVGLACGLDVMRMRDTDADQVTLAFISRFLNELNLGHGLRVERVTEEHIPKLVEQAWEDPCHLTNPVPISKEDLRELYLKAL
ncbi:MAG: iron-containing alcohol dehydrogenase [Verrucomicrobiota bacterium]|nr:iron-containing alcohol dehydrogenase [Verrucomicrobiota bacterium]